MPESSTWHCIILHNIMVLHTKKLFLQPCYPRKKISSEKKLLQSSLIHPRSPHTSLSNSEYDSNTNLISNVSLFPSLGLVLGLRSNQPLAHSRYISLHATTRVAYYFYFYLLCKYYQTNEDGGVLENLYYLQVFHTNKDGVVLGNPIQDTQHEISSRESIMRFTL